MKVYFFASFQGKQPVNEFITLQDVTERVKIYEVIGYLQEYGLQLPIHYLKRLKGTKKLWELRIKHTKQYRIFLVKTKKRDIILLHAFIKKTQKTPKKEIELAEKRLQTLK